MDPDSCALARKSSLFLHFTAAWPLTFRCARMHRRRILTSEHPLERADTLVSKMARCEVPAQNCRACDLYAGAYMRRSADTPPHTHTHTQKSFE